MEFRTEGMPDDLRDAVEAAALADRTTVDEVAIEAMKHGIAQRALDRLKRRAEMRRSGKSDERVDAIVEAAIIEIRGR